MLEATWAAMDTASSGSSVSLKMTSACERLPAFGTIQTKWANIGALANANTTSDRIQRFIGFYS